MKENLILQKTYVFALKIVRLYKSLLTEHKEYILGRQILRSGTSIGANMEEAIGGQSRRDFYAKMTIAYKEARETHYWLRLLTDTQYIPSAQSRELLGDVEEILRIITAIQKTMRTKM